MNKLIKEFIKMLKKRWYIDNTKKWKTKHIKLLCPCWKHILIVSSTPSDCMAIRENMNILNRFSCTKEKFK